MTITQPNRHNTYMEATRSLDQDQLNRLEARFQHLQVIRGQTPTEPNANLSYEVMTDMVTAYEQITGLEPELRSGTTKCGRSVAFYLPDTIFCQTVIVFYDGYTINTLQQTPQHVGYQP